MPFAAWVVMKTSRTDVVVKVSVPSEPAPPHDPVNELAPSGTTNLPPGGETPIVPGHPVQPAHPSSVMASQSSSTPLQLSMGGTHAPKVQSGAHVRVPVEPHEVMQVAVSAGVHANPSSTFPSQSSSDPLQVSAGGAQAPHAQLPEQVRDPVEPQTVMQLPLAPAQQANPSSHAPLQSSSTPLQVSAGGEHTLQPHAALHVRLPVVPQLVMHEPVDPAQQAKVSSHMVSQSSSLPLHASTGGTHAPHVHAAVHVRVPVVPQDAVHVPVDAGTHVKVSSTRPSQSSSAPLQVSAGAMHVPNVQPAPQD